MDSRFAPPTGAAPPSVPEGWTAQFNEQYQAWFYVNLHTKQSQWEIPTEPALPGPARGVADGAPPSYDQRIASPGFHSEQNNGPAFSTNNPYASHHPNDDARLAAQLQAEEDARARGATSTSGAQNNYQNTPVPYAYDQQQYAAAPHTEERSNHSRSSKSGLLGKLLGKVSSSSHGLGSSNGYGHQSHSGFGGYPPRRRRGGGMGLGGGMAMGGGAGLLGGMALASGLGHGHHGHHGHHGGHGGYGYDDGYDQGMDDGGGGGDFGGDGGGDGGGGD
ncbi:MAG: hypothetical protein M1837_004276 [Sclerophora amabilis]|nr:MAG: hypothetical protein M1837_004276 [Sclerophora amabilis]